MRKTRYTIDECFSEAKKYKTRSELFKANQCAYTVLKKAGRLDEACDHMQISDKYSFVRWTREAVFAEALKYKNRAEFRRENQGAYGYALKNKMLHQACHHMRDGQNFWHIFELMAVAVKYQNKPEFIRCEKQAYTYANKHKLVDIICSHMEKHCTTWTKELVMVEAAKHQARGLFQLASPGAYKHADKYDYLDEACAHMPEPEYGFSKEKPAILYHIRITTPEGIDLYKIGITNRTPERRIAGLGLPAGASAEVLGSIIFPSGRDARIAEKRLHRRLAAYRYKGVPPLKNGNTELFTVAAFEH